MAENRGDVLRCKILEELQRDGRLTNQDLADRVGSSASPVWRRVKELEQSGVIRRYAALLDPDKVGVGECVFTHITLEKHNQDMYDNFERAVKDRSEILECYAITGDSDFILKVHIPSIRAYDRLLNDFIFRIPGVVHVKSSFTLREIKYDTALPIEGTV